MREVINNQTTSNSTTTADISGNTVYNATALYTSDKPILVVSDKIDATSVIEAGGNAIAIGSLANIDSLIELIDKNEPVQPLVLAINNDKAGKKAKTKIVQYLGEKNHKYWTYNISGHYNSPTEAFRNDKEQFLKEVAIAVDYSKVIKIEYEKSSAYYDCIDFISTIKNNLFPVPIATGYDNLDKLLDGGLIPGLYIVGAISSLGKTTFCLQIADYIAKHGNDVIYVSLEMDSRELIAKIISSKTYTIDSGNAVTTRELISRYNHSPEKLNVINSATSDFGNYGKNIHIKVGVADISTDEIDKMIEKHIGITGNHPVVIIDYLQIIKAKNPRATDKQNTDAAVVDLKRISRDNNVPIITISSFNRDNYTTAVNMASFKESGAIEYSSDVLIGLQYAGMDDYSGDKKGVAEIIAKANKMAKDGKPIAIQAKVLKNRNGCKGSATLNFLPCYNYYSSGR